MQASDFFQVLDNPYRRKILRLLEDGPLTAGEIGAQLEISQPSVSRHLELLKRTGFVDSWRTGTFINYKLDHFVEQEIVDHLSEVFPRQMEQIRA